MIENDVFEAFNNRLVSVTELKKLTPAQLDRVKQLGTAAENLLKNKDFVLFIRQFQLETMDTIVEVTGYTAESINEMAALGNSLKGIDSFINLLKRQVYLKNQVVSQQRSAQDPTNE